MGRFLFVVPPLTGHVNPTVSLGGALQRRGHEVAWVAHRSAVGALLPSNATVLPLDEGPLVAHQAQIRERTQAVRGLLAFKQLWEEFFIPLARAMRPGVEEAVDRYRPDVLLVDQQAFAGALTARKRSLRWATLATTSAQLSDSLVDLPKVREWVDGLLAGLESEAGLVSSLRPDLSPHLLLVFSSEALAGVGRFPPQTRFVGPALEGREDATPFPWDALRPGPRVFASLGTVNASRGEPVYRVLFEALGNEALQVVLVAPPEQATGAPRNFLILPRVPQLAVLPHVQAVLCHAGHNTVCEALAQGLPLVVMPIRDDQPVIAEQVVRAGVGIRLRFGRTRPDELRDAVRRALSAPDLREAARRIQSSFRAAGGTAAAADAVEALL
jgi:UDP:flavonoid glycosyltransferase YjiC (YdhE family)